MVSASARSMLSCWLHCYLVRRTCLLTINEVDVDGVYGEGELVENVAVDDKVGEDMLADEVEVSEGDADVVGVEVKDAPVDAVELEEVEEAEVLGEEGGGCGGCTAACCACGGGA